MNFVPVFADVLFVIVLQRTFAHNGCHVAGIGFLNACRFGGVLILVQL